MQLPTKLSACLVFCALGSPAFGQVSFTDDFERTELGPDWTVSGGSWTIVDGTLRGGGGDSTTQDHFAFYNGLELTGSWTMVANVEFLGVNLNWQGFGLNIQDDAGTWRSYIDRVRTQESFGSAVEANHHFLEGAGAGPGSLSFPNTNTSPPKPVLDTGTIYTFELGWTEGLSEEISLAISDGGTSIFSHTFSIAGWTDLTGAGFAGLYDARSMAVHDYTVTVIPEPRATAAAMAAGALLLVLWARRRRAPRS